MTGQIYFDQLAELYEWEDERKAMVLDVCQGGDRMALAGVNVAQQYSKNAPLQK